MSRDVVASSFAGDDWPEFTREMVIDGYREVSSWRQLDSMRNGIASLMAKGLMVKDIADAIYSSPRVFDAMTEGDYEAAAQLVTARTVEATKEIAECGLDCNSCVQLSLPGFSAGEIAWAIRNIHGLREALSEGELKVIATSLHSFFARTGRPIHQYLSTARHP